jgi:hypothetical protein
MLTERIETLEETMDKEGRVNLGEGLNETCVEIEYHTVIWNSKIQYVYFILNSLSFPSYRSPPPDILMTL